MDEKFAIRNQDFDGQQMFAPLEDAVVGQIE